jgi:hypothetical protein
VDGASGALKRLDHPAVVGEIPWPGPLGHFAPMQPHHGTVYGQQGQTGPDVEPTGPDVEPTGQDRRADGQAPEAAGFPGVGIGVCQRAAAVDALKTAARSLLSRQPQRAGGQRR